MSDAGLDNRFFAILEETLKKRTKQMRKAGNYDDPLTEHLEISLNQGTDKQFGPFSQEQRNEVTFSVLDSNTADRHLQTLRST